MSVDHPTLLAALDLGSNSFHLLISEWRDGRLLEVKRHKDLVQLARAINEHGQLDANAMDRALSSLKLCRSILDQHPIVYLRVVGTAILRQCQDPEIFLHAAETILKAPIEIISGDEEAALVYRGVTFGLSQDERSKRLLVLDVGGASTEIICADHGAIDEKVSLSLGCVTLANQFFDSRTSIAKSSLEASYDFAASKFSPVKARLNSPSFDLALGASGTIRVLLDFMSSKTQLATTNIITKTQIRDLFTQIAQTGSMDASLAENLRWDVLPAGIALLKAFFDVYGIEQLQVSPHSIKEGMMLQWLDQSAPDHIL